eukprot:CAMPEP_0170183206 /NCGR_PEP_ID=MMETSP0040_2-20121228/29962_1 /TAXON_ID=641309 /ORGANISM="Lotharella oceanica, Strain CCMP622" /LENGTH=191 /DNA_ID=CAMNT_0010428865 /DNA_START=75 /DNA_END=650 /DNA_ORIENTATION=+
MSPHLAFACSLLGDAYSLRQCCPQLRADAFETALKIYEKQNDLRSHMNLFRGLVEALKDRGDVLKLKTYVDIWGKTIEKEIKRSKDVVDQRLIQQRNEHVKYRSYVDGVMSKFQAALVETKLSEKSLNAQIMKQTCPDAKCTHAKVHSQAGNVYCDFCQREVKAGESSYGCRHCDFDSCKSCAIKQWDCVR